MQQKLMGRADVIMAGVGGKGVLTIGLVLAEVGLKNYRYATYFPCYIGFMRGFPCECTVVLSDEKIASTVVYRTDAVIILEASQLFAFVHRAKPGGLIVVEKAGLTSPVDRADVTVVEVPGVELASKAGSSQAANFVLLGTYIETSKVLPVEMVAQEIGAKSPQASQLGKVNRKAFEVGVELARGLKT